MVYNPLVSDQPDREGSGRQVGETSLDISSSFACEAIAKGEIPCIRIRTRILFPKVAQPRC